jgi:hypothetical protein
MNFHLFIYGSFNDTASSSGYTVLNSRLINKLEGIWGGSGAGSIQELSLHLLRGAEENKEQSQ